jgi:hypothetical protein
MTKPVRTCKSCKKELPFDKFPADKKGVKTHTCNPCTQKRRNKFFSSSPENYLRVLLTSARNQAKSGKRAGMQFSIKVDDLLELWDQQEGKCALSNVIMTHVRDGQGSKDFNVSLDRISNESGYVPGNVQLVCYRVNIMKHTCTEDIFMWWVKNIHDFSCH